jgi:hypothetical protein
MEDVNDHKKRVCAADWPTFMYDFSRGYDPNNMDLGLCCGLILVCVSGRHYSDQIVNGISGFPSYLHRTIIGTWDAV